MGELATNMPYSEPQMGRFRRFYRKYPDRVRAAIILVPLIGWWVVIAGFPTLFGFILGFCDWTDITRGPQFAGIDNYITFFTTSTYLSSFWRAIWMGGLCAGVSLLFGFGAALLMNLPIFGKGLYRTIWYIPAVTSGAAMTQIFNLWLDPSIGIINNVLKGLGLQPVIWGYSTYWMVFWIVAYSAWKGIGGAALLWLAGLQSVDPQLYEAAMIDGASSWQCFKFVTIPGLRPIITYVLITTSIGAVQIYEQVTFISNGGPFGSTEVLMYKIFQDAFLNRNLGMAGASSMIMAVLVIALSLFTWNTREKEA